MLSDYQKQMLRHRINQNKHARRNKPWFFQDDRNHHFMGTPIDHELRFQYVDEMKTYYPINHTGWFADPFQENTYRGLVIRLPHNRFLSGYANQESECFIISMTTFDDESNARSFADDLARREAEDAIEQSCKAHAEDLISDIAADIKAMRQDLVKLRHAVKNAPMPPSIREAVTLRIRHLKNEMKAMYEKAQELERNPSIVME